MANESLIQQRLQKLYEDTRKMRYHQEMFFKLGKTDPTRKGHFDEARKKEQAVDGHIKIMEYEGIVTKVL